MRRLLPIALCVVSILQGPPLQAETPPEQQQAVQEIRKFASNIQYNRDGTVRFVRFSRPTVTDEHVAKTAALAQLDYLAVVTPTVSDEGLSHVAGLSNLDTLFLSDSGVTDATLLTLGALPKLERLYLDRTSISDSGLSGLAGLKSLNTLSLIGTSITDQGLEHLADLESLEVLFLSGTRITDSGLGRLSQLGSVKALFLDGTEIDGSGFGEWDGLDSLEHLSLRDAAIDAASLASLVKLSNLRQLSLLDTGLTKTDAAELQRRLPKLSITFTPPESRRRNALERFLAGESLSGPSSTTRSTLAGTSQPNRQQNDVAAPISMRIDDSAETPDFQRHVLPLLGRLGCNGRTCHGSFQGQGGFSLSMFGYDFEADHQALTGGDEPRVDVERPDDSLIVAKPTDEDNHGGGQRFEIGSWEHRLLRSWIASGAKGLADGPGQIERFDVAPAEINFTRPGETVQLTCVAVWDDGTREDVTPLTRFQSNDDVVAEVSPSGLVTCLSPGDTDVISFYDNGIASTPVMLPVSDRTGDRFPDVETPTEIDRLVTEKLAKLGVVPSQPCTDEEFLRRVSLDVAGTLPTPQEIEAFLDDRSPEKRDRKIDELLESPAYADWWAMRLSDLTGSNSQYLGTTDMNTPAALQWNAWIRRRVQDNAGWDRIAAGIILAQSRRPGQTYDQYVAEQSLHMRKQAPSDFTAPDNPMHYYWFRSNNQQPTERALSFGYVFLGVRLQCAQCHKHPFDQWSKQEFESFTQFFTRVKAGIAPDAKESQDQLKTKLGVPKKLDTAALRRQMYNRVSAEGLPIPWNEIWIEPPGEQPQIAKILGGEQLDLNDYSDPREPLMAWLLSEENPYFARAFVNRVWHHYFGVGIVEPPDDFNMANPPSNKALLDWLTRQFVAHGYDMKWLHRTITRSRTYQLSWRPNETNRLDERNFSHALVRRLPAEVTVDAIMQATAGDERMESWSRDTTGRKITQHPKSIQTRGIDYSLLIFGKPRRTTNCDCERQQQPTLLQSLYVRNDRELLERLERKDGWLVATAENLGETLSPETTASTNAAAKTETKVDSSTWNDLIDRAYLRTVSRMPTESEVARSRRHLAAADSTSEGLRDLMWALLNTQEFLTNH